jgi:SAM-dependent methyltransferase
MLDLVASLPAGARVLDLGARSGSFRTERSGLSVIRLDLEAPPARGSGSYVIADAARMPFRSRSFDLVISNHSLEHFPELEQTLREVGRVIRTGGAFYAAVPDAATLTDRVYRWLGRGGGHVNLFRSPGDVISLVKKSAGLRHRRTRALFSGFSFLNAHNFAARPPRKIALFAFGHEGFLAVFTWVLRWLDRLLGTRLSHYGWSFYFGEADPPEGEESWANVCVRCGSGHPEAFLRAAGVVRRVTYRCPACGGWNLLTRDRSEGPRDGLA